MREFDTIGIKLCDEQAELFELSLTNKNIGSELFIKRFAYSDLAKKFDDLSILNQIISLETELANINKNKKEPVHIGKRYSSETLFWMGYIYRYWSYTYEESTINIYKMMPPSKLSKYYEIYHTLDSKQAIDRIIEAHDFEDKKSIEYGIKQYRLIMKSKR